jgi:hypothetical protein
MCIRMLHACIHTRMHMHPCINTYVHTYVACMHTYAHAHASVHMHAGMHACMRAQAHKLSGAARVHQQHLPWMLCAAFLCIHTYAHIIYVHSYKCSSPLVTFVSNAIHTCMHAVKLRYMQKLWLIGFSAYGCCVHTGMHRCKPSLSATLPRPEYLCIHLVHTSQEAIRSSVEGCQSRA